MEIIWKYFTYHLKMMFLSICRYLAFRPASGNEFSLRLSRRVDPLWPVVPGREFLAENHQRMEVVQKLGTC